MSKHRDSSGSPHDTGAGGEKDRRQDNPSAHRSFHPDEYAPEPGPGRKVSEEEHEGVTGDTAESSGRSGEKYAKKAEKGMHGTGRKGKSGRPSGGRDASATTGVDAQEPGSGAGKG